MTILEPIIPAKFSEKLIGEMTPTEAIRFMVIIGYSTTELKNQNTFDAALRDLTNQVKNN